MANVTTVRLPDALLLSNDYVALNTDQRESFLARIMHCMEIAAAAEIAASQTGNEFLSGIDDIELDAFSVMSSSSDIARSVSPYLVHSSWTFESDKVGLSAQVDKVRAEFLSSASFLLHSSEAEMKSWLGKWASIMRATRDRFERSLTYTEVVAQLIVMNALVALVLVFSAAARLNPTILDVPAARVSND
jgi:hypothetical protein